MVQAARRLSGARNRLFRGLSFSECTLCLLASVYFYLSSQNQVKRE